MTSAQQLPLRFRLDNEATFDNFFVTDGAALAVHEVRRQAHGDGERFICLVGGSGRSHLLQASCAAADSVAAASRYIPVKSVADSAPEWVLDGVESCDLLCLDDVDAIIGDRSWETALFNAYNAALSRGQAWLVSCQSPPLARAFCLADLHSRMRGFSTYRLPALTDEALLEIVSMRCRARGINIDDAVVRYILARGRRDLHSLVDVVVTLDRASLQLKRKVTIPLVKDVMGWRE